MIRLRSVLLPLGTGLLAASTARGQSATNCDAAATNLEIRQCINKAAARADTLLTQVVDSIAQTLDSTSAGQLRQAQMVWTDYRKRQCAAIAAVYAEGTMAPVASLQCMLELTEDRLQFLRANYPLGTR